MSIWISFISIIKIMSLFNNKIDWDIIKSIFINGIIFRNRIIYKIYYKVKYKVYLFFLRISDL